MNANSVIQTSLTHWTKNLEVGTYALLAFVFIGHLFVVTAQVHALNIALLGIGTIFGMMAAPVLKNLNAAPAFRLADVFVFNKSETTQTDNNSDTRHAA